MLDLVVNIGRLVPELSDDACKDFLQTVFWISSASIMEDNPIDWLRLNPEAFPNLWKSAMQDTCVLDCSPLIGPYCVPYMYLSGSADPN